MRQILSGNPIRIFAGYTEEELYNSQIAFNLVAKAGTPFSLLFILAILNSRLIDFFHRNRFLDQTKQVFQKILIENARQLPVCSINLDNSSHKARYDDVCSLSKRMLQAQKGFSTAKTEAREDVANREILVLDRQIDAAVYELYGLTEEEIAIVEGTEKKG